MAPGNDNFADATVITGTSGTVSGTTTAGTVEVGEPGSASGQTVWYSWTPTGDTRVAFTVPTADFDSLLQAYTGSAVGALDSIGAVEGGGPLLILAAGGTTYHLRVSGYEIGEVGDFTMAWDLSPLPPLSAAGTETHDGTATIRVGMSALATAGWEPNGQTHGGTATISIGETTVDGLTFTSDPDLLDVPDMPVFPTPPPLTTGPYARQIRKVWLNITAGPHIRTDRHHQPDADSWAYTVHHGDWGHYRIHVGTKNVTSFRGVQTIITQLSATDPFGDDTCGLLFPAIGPFEKLGDGDLHWLPGTDTDRHIPLKISHVHPDGTTSVHFEGDIAGEVDTYDGTTGALAVNGLGVIKTLDDRITKPRFTSDPIDIGHLIHQWTKYEVKYGWHGHPCRAHTTGIKTAERGGYGDPLATTTIQNLLATAQTGEGHKWTLMPHRPRGMRMHRRDLDTVHFTLHCGQMGVTHDLTRDLGSAVRGIYGEGQDRGIQFWRNTQYPNAPISPPDYPLSPGDVYHPGDSTGGLQPFTDELNSRGYHLDSNDTYRASDSGAIREFQTDAGILTDAIIGPQTWSAAFQTGLSGKALYAWIRPLAVSPGAEPFRYNGRGGIVGRNHDYDHRTRRERLEQYGTLSKHDARQSAHRELPIVAHADFAGTVTLENIDPPQLGALSIRAGMNFVFKNHRGVDRKFHVAKVDKDPGMRPGGSRRVVLTTSERGDDYVTLAARIQRNKGVVDQSGRTRPSHRSSKRTPDFAPWDSESGAGHLTPVAQYGGLWNVYQMPAGELGSVVHVRLVANTPTLIAAAVFNRRVTARQLTKLPGLADPSAGAAGGEDPWTVNAKRLTRTLKFKDQPWMAWATGGPGAMQGYWPNTPAADATVTGVLDDGDQWAFHSARPPWLWLAVWTRDSCRISGDPNFEHRALFPGAPLQ